MVLILLVHFCLVLFCSFRLSPAYDEPSHIRSGLNMMTREAFVDTRHAPWTRPNPVHPPADMVPALFARGNGQDPDCRATDEVAFRNILAARWANHLAGALVLLLAWLCSRTLWGPWPGLLAPVFVLVQPLFITHATLVSSDLYGALGGLVAVWVVWRLYVARSEIIPACLADFGLRLWAGGAAAGLAVGLAVTFKLGNLILVPLLGLVPFLAALGSPGRETEPWWRRGSRGLVAGAVACVVALAVAALVYGATHRLLPPLTVGGRPVQLPVGQALAVCASFAVDLKSYLYAPYFMGRIAEPSPLQYGVAFLLKTPLGVLAISAGVLIAAVSKARGRHQRRGVTLLLGLSAVMVLLFTTRGFYLGLRHLLLPIVLLAPLAGALGCAGTRSGSARARWLAPGLAAACLAWGGAELVRTVPWTVAYFNALGRGQMALVDSDGDWGEGLVALGEWQRRHSPLEPIWLAYFGNVRPESYGIRYRGLYSPFSSVRQDPQRELARDPERIGGWVVISKTHLAGTYFAADGASPDYYAAWRRLQPDFVIGGSLLAFDRRGSTAPSHAAR
jgi:hypothetical protein